MIRKAASSTTLLLLLFAINSVAEVQQEKRVFRILNWSEYIQLDDDTDASLSIVERSPILRAFAKQYNCEIAYDEFDDSYEGWELLAALPGYYDLICASDTDAIEMFEAALIEKIDKAELPHFKPQDIPEIFPSLQGNFEYGIPYLIGTTGIIYRTDLIKTPPKRWENYFNASETNDHHIQILSDADVTFSLLLHSCGKDRSSPSSDDYEQAAALLTQLRDNNRIGLISSEYESIESALADGTVAMAICYSGDALSLIEDNKNLAYIIPEDGGEVYTDLWCFPSESKNRDLAYAFVNYISQPVTSAENSYYLGYANPSADARSQLKAKYPDHLLDTVVYPTKEIRSKLFPINNDADMAAFYWRRIYP